jgi:hypothetical protein
MIFFVWVPSHCGVYGNEGADLCAKNATKLKVIDIPIKLNIFEIKAKLKKDMVEKWQNDWITLSNRTVISQVKPKISLRHNSCDLGRHGEVIIHRLRVGKCSLNYYLYKMGKHPDGRCDVCLVSETINHVILLCGKYNSQRKILFGKLTKKYENNVTPNLRDILGGKYVSFKDVCLFVRDCGMRI